MIDWMDVFGGYIAKHFKSQKQAERYQGHLYANYATVRCTKIPERSEAGIYEWYVCE